MAKRRRQPPPSTACPEHPVGPLGYVEWFDWVDEMALTHDCKLCEKCGLWAIWEPRARTPLGAKLRLIRERIADDGFALLDADGVLREKEARRGQA